jgi:hypothetical protein
MIPSAWLQVEADKGLFMAADPISANVTYLVTSNVGEFLGFRDRLLVRSNFIAVAVIILYGWLLWYSSKPRAGDSRQTLADSRQTVAVAPPPLLKSLSKSRMSVRARQARQSLARYAEYILGSVRTVLSPLTRLKDVNRFQNIPLVLLAVAFTMTAVVWNGVG